MASTPATRDGAIDCLSLEAQQLAEARLAAKRAARAEAREIRMKELERQQKEVEERPERDFAEKGSRNMPSLSAAALASLGGTSSRRGSGDTSISAGTEASIREIKDSLAEVEEKYKKAMVSNAQLDNEKTNFMYQVDTLKDILLQVEEELAESRRQYEDKSKEFEREKHAHGVLKSQFAEVKEALKQREEMLEKHGIALDPERATNGTVGDNGQPVPSEMAEQEAAALTPTGDGALGRATAAEVDSEVVAAPRQERPAEGRAEPCPHSRGPAPAADPKDPRPAEGRAPAPEPPARAESEERAPLCPGTAPEAPEPLGDVSGEGPAPEAERHCGKGPDREDGQEDSVARQAGREREAGEGPVGEIGGAPCLESGPPHGAPVGRAGGADARGPRGSLTESEGEAGVASVGEHAGAVASSPRGGSEDPVDQEGSHAGSVPANTDTSCGFEKGLASQDVAEPTEAPTQPVDAGGASVVEGGTESTDEEATPAGVQAAAATRGHQQAEGAGEGGPEGPESLDLKEPGEDEVAHGGEPSQKKTKNKKKKNKKKKPLGPAEALGGVEEAAFQNPGQSQVSAERPESRAQERPAGAGAEQKAAPGGSEGAEGPGAPLDGALSHEDGGVGTEARTGLAGGDVFSRAGDAALAPSDLGASAEGAGESVATAAAGRDGASQGCPPDPEQEDRGSSPSEEEIGADQAVAVGREAEDGAGSTSADQHDASPPLEEPDGLEAGPREDPSGESANGKSKEDCTMS